MQITPVRQFQTTNFKQFNSPLKQAPQSNALSASLPLLNISAPYFGGKNKVSSAFKENFFNTLREDSKKETPFFKKADKDAILRLSAKLHTDKPIVIGISGKSASGKSTLTDEFKNILEENGIEVSLINADNYFKDISSLIKKHGSFDNVQKSGYEIDSPSNFYLEQLKEDVLTLKNGQSVRTPRYRIDGTGISVPKEIPVKANKIILVEGMATSFSPVRDNLDLSVYVDIDNETRKSRFMERAGSRNQTPEEALNLFNYTEDAGNKYLLPEIDGFDVVVDGGYSLKDFSKLMNSIIPKQERREV